MVSDRNTLVNCIFRTLYMAMAFNFTKIELFASYKWQRDLKAFVLNFCKNLNLGTVSITRGSGV